MQTSRTLRAHKYETTIQINNSYDIESWYHVSSNEIQISVTTDLKPNMRPIKSTYAILKPRIICTPTNLRVWLCKSWIYWFYDVHPKVVYPSKCMTKFDILIVDLECPKVIAADRFE